MILVLTLVSTLSACRDPLDRLDRSSQVFDKASPVEVGFPRMPDHRAAVLLVAGTRRQLVHLDERADLRFEGRAHEPRRGRHPDLVRVGHEHGASKTIKLERATYVKRHPVSNYDPASGQSVLSQEVDVARLIVVNGKWLVFGLDVVGSAVHTGHIEGVARVEHGRAVYVDDEQPECSLTFDLLAEGRLRVDELNDLCYPYHGARVRFTGTFTLQAETAFRWPT